MELYSQLMDQNQASIKPLPEKHIKAIKKRGVCSISRSHIKKVRKGLAKLKFSDYHAFVLDESQINLELDFMQEKQSKAQNKTRTDHTIKNKTWEQMETSFGPTLNSYVRNHSKDLTCNIPGCLNMKQVRKFCLKISQV